MPGENLTRAEATERAGVVTVRSYEVALDLTTGPTTFGSTTVVRFAATPGASTFIDLIDAEGEADVEVTIAVGEEPATVELFATVGSLAEIE